MSRPSTGSHNLLRLRKALRKQQDEFAQQLRVSTSLLKKLEHEQAPLLPHVAENIAAYTGISPGWLLRNDPSEPLTDSNGNPYTLARYERAQLERFRVDLLPTHVPSILVRTLLMQRYAEARDLLLRPEMYKHLIKFLLDFQLLVARYELKANFPARMTAADFINAQHRREKPDRLFPGIIKDAEQCYKAVKLQRERLAREETKKAKRLVPFLAPEEAIHYRAGTRLFTLRDKRTTSRRNAHK